MIKLLQNEQLVQFFASQCTRRAKSNPPRKNSISLKLYQLSSPNLYSLQMRIQSTYPASFVKITVLWFNRYNSLNFKVKFTFQLAYSRVLNIKQ